MMKLLHGRMMAASWRQLSYENTNDFVCVVRNYMRFDCEWKCDVKVDEVGWEVVEHVNTRKWGASSFFPCSESAPSQRNERHSDIDAQLAT